MVVFTGHELTEHKASAATRLIYRLRTSDHRSDALISPHWLRVLERIRYKLAVLAYKVLHGDAPRYLSPLTSVVDLPGRSTNAYRLVVPPVTFLQGRCRRSGHGLTTFFCHESYFSILCLVKS